MFPTNANAIVSARVFIRSPFERLYSFEMLYEPDATLSALTYEQWLTTAENYHSDVAEPLSEVMDSHWQIAMTELRFVNVEEREVRVHWNGAVPGDEGGVASNPVDDGEVFGGRGLLNALPSYSALLIRKITGKAGRHRRGRMFIPGISEVAQEDGLIAGDFHSSAKGIADFFHTVWTDPGSGGTMAPRLWNLKENKLEVVIRCQAVDALVTRRDRKLGRKGLAIQ